MDSLFGSNTQRFLKFAPAILWSLFMGVIEWFLPRSWYAKDVSKDVILITGAGSGLGRAIALEYARLSSALVLWDINENGLRETKELVDAEYESQKMDDGMTDKCSTYVVDVSDRQTIIKAASQVNRDLNKHRNLNSPERFVSVLVNNAGIYYGLNLQDLSDQQIEKVFNINILAHFWTVRAFLPQMMEHKRGHIVEVASMAGIAGLNKQVDYSATKFATVGFEEALNIELHHLGYSNEIHTTVICPFFFSSNLFTDFNTKAGSLMTCEYVAKETVMAMRCNHSRVLLPKLNAYALFVIKTYMPRQTIVLLTKALGLSDSIKTIKGRATAAH